MITTPTSQHAGCREGKARPLQGSPERTRNHCRGEVANRNHREPSRAGLALRVVEKYQAASEGLEFRLSKSGLASPASNGSTSPTR